MCLTMFIIAALVVYLVFKERSWIAEKLSSGKDTSTPNSIQVDAPTGTVYAGRMQEDLDENHTSITLVFERVQK